MMAEQLSQATMWRHGLKRTEASISEQYILDTLRSEREGEREGGMEGGRERGREAERKAHPMNGHS